MVRRDDRTDGRQGRRPRRRADRSRPAAPEDRRPEDHDQRYIAMRWYQHRVHGVDRATSEKYRLPTVARVAMATRR